MLCFVLILFSVAHTLVTAAGGAMHSLARAVQEPGSSATQACSASPAQCVPVAAGHAGGRHRARVRWLGRQLSGGAAAERHHQLPHLHGADGPYCEPCDQVSPRQMFWSMSLVPALLTAMLQHWAVGNSGVRMSFDTFHTRPALHISQKDDSNSDLQQKQILVVLCSGRCCTVLYRLIFGVSPLQE